MGLNSLGHQQEAAAGAEVDSEIKSEGPEPRQEKTKMVRVRFSRSIIEKFLNDGGILPLEVLVMTMREQWRQSNYEAACALAVQAAPFLHPRLASIEMGMGDEEISRVARLPAVVQDIADWQRQYDPNYHRQEVLPPERRGSTNGFER